MNDLVVWETSGPVGTITLNRPERHNSLIPQLLQQLQAILARAAVDTSLWALVLRANGRSFSTGGDLAGFAQHMDNLSGYADLLVGLLNQVMLTMIDLPQPIIAAVHSAVTGGSVGLVLASDIVLVAPEASFTPYYAVVGFAPDGGWTTLLPRLIGRRHAAHSLVCNRSILAEEAVAWGLASQLVSTGRLLEVADASAHHIATLQPGSLQVIKRLLWSDADEIAAGLHQERQRFVARMATAEARSGMETFLASLRRG